MNTMPVKEQLKPLQPIDVLIKRENERK